MVDESKIIFFTGAPGSKWSATAHLIGMNPIFPINNSDYSPDRHYEHPMTAGPEGPVAHQGAYWGPGNEFGKHFHKLHERSKEEIIAEIEKPYEDKSWDKYRIIKCHQFANQLDWIHENFPTSPIICVMRPDSHCLVGWRDGADGWNSIKYPDYKTYYQNNDKLKKEIERENLAVRYFVNKHDIEIHKIRDTFWSRYWGMERSDSNEISRYMDNVELRALRHKVPYLAWTVDLAVFKLGDGWFDR